MRPIPIKKLSTDSKIFIRTRGCWNKWAAQSRQARAPWVHGSHFQQRDGGVSVYLVCALLAFEQLLQHVDPGENQLSALDYLN